MTAPTLQLIVQLYGEEGSDSHSRMLQCIQKNAELDFVKLITVVCEGNTKPLHNEKIQAVPSTGRRSYADLLKLAQSNNTKPATTHIAVANTDIFLSNDILLVMARINDCSHVAAISRTEMSGRLYEQPKWSQDLWLFRSHRFTPDTLKSTWQRQGVAGCEQLFAMALYSQGYDIWNPCLDCTIVHNDSCPKNEWSKRYYGSYLYLPACSIGDIATTPAQYEIVVARGEFKQDTSPSIPRPDGPQALKLHLCCGDKKIAGFTGVDIREEVHPDIIGSVENLSMIGTETAEEIYFCHGLEHINQAKAKHCLRELHRVLKKGGLLRLALPDFDALTRLYVGGFASIEDIAPAIHGAQDYPHNTHYSSWDIKSLTKILHESGFRNTARYNAHEFLPSNYFDWSLHSLYGITTSLNVTCTKQ